MLDVTIGFFYDKEICEICQIKSFIFRNHHNSNLVVWLFQMNKYLIHTKVNF